MNTNEMLEKKKALEDFCGLLRSPEQEECVDYYEEQVEDAKGKNEPNEEEA